MNMDITEQVNIYILAYVMDTTDNDTLISNVTPLYNKQGFSVICHAT